MSSWRVALRETSVCPLCKSTEYDEQSYPLDNLYSEQLAGMLDCAERDLLDTLVNKRCQACGLWYKAQWFAPDVLTELFRECVPIHPKGWDAQSERFSEQGWASELDGYASAIEVGNGGQIARFQRGLYSILDSIVDSGSADLIQQSQTAIRDRDVTRLRALLPQFTGLFTEPFPFKRFSGFSARSLWDWLSDNVGIIQQYAEIGCPLWGQLAKLPDSGVRRWYFVRPEPNYWGDGCRMNQVHCVQSLCSKAPVHKIHWNDPQSVRMNVLGAFQYLDHLQDPLGFIAEAFVRAQNVLLILDGVDQPPAVQHFTGWSDSSIAWLANGFGKKVVADFYEISPSGNRAWLLTGD